MVTKPSGFLCIGDSLLDASGNARRALSLITKLAHAHAIARRQYRLMPKFINGPSIECRGIK